MRALHVAAASIAALMASACAGHPERIQSEQEQIISSIVSKERFGNGVSCPSNATRYCHGPHRAMTCRCVSAMSLRALLHGIY